MSDKNFEAWGTIDLPRDKEGRFVPPTVRRLYYRDGAPYEVKWLCLSPKEVRISDGPIIVAWRAVLDGIDETVPLKQLCLEQPDSWEALERDADVDPLDYCAMNGVKVSTGHTPYSRFARDLVRRAKALAGADGKGGEARGDE